MRNHARMFVRFSMFTLMVMALSGCPMYPNYNGDYVRLPIDRDPTEYPEYTEDLYDEGYYDGFYTDSKYWEGFDDSYLTKPPDGPILYRGGEIPLYEDGSYEAGYWDGIWYAYNDGYFVSYDYGFVIGFSEGYDIGYDPYWFEFLLNDEHPEYYDGSFMDGYQDGFSEGSVFGAVDYDLGLVFDWETAMWDYRAGEDVYIESLEFGTGAYGVVYLYEYGTDPNINYEKGASEAKRSKIYSVRQARRNSASDDTPSPRASVAVAMKQLKQDETEQITYRALSEAIRTQFDVRPQHSPRSTQRSLTLTDTWLQRIERYNAQRQ